MADESDGYWLARNSQASSRLNLQHFWNQLTCGYLIHPDIALDNSARIADIGTGTGIWPISLSASLPSGVQLDGFDITDAQFPPKKWLPSNVRLDRLNILESIPDHLVGQYDVVNIRYFLLIVRKNNLSTLVNNLISLLKPGGYLQWTEINIAEQQIVSALPDTSVAATSCFSEDGKKGIADLGVEFSWLNSLPTMCQKSGLVNVRQFKPAPVPALRLMSSYVALDGWEEFSHTVLDRTGPHPVLGSGEDLRRRLHEVRKEIQNGAAIDQIQYITIGQRSI